MEDKKKPDIELLATLADGMLEPTVIIDWEGNLLHGNGLAAEVIGASSPSDLVGMNLGEFVHPDSAQQAAIDLERVKNSEADFSAKYKLLVNGQTIDIESHGTKIELADGSVDLVSFRDVTEKRRAENDVQRRERLFQSIVENANDIIYTLSTDGVFTYVSPNWKSILGHESDEVIGTPFMPYVHPDDLPGCMVVMQKVLESGEPAQGIEYRVQHLDGSWKWHMTNASRMTSPEGLTIFTGIARDVTERKRVEEELIVTRGLLEDRVKERTAELDRNEKMFRALTESMHAMVIIVNVKNENVIYANPAATELTGYSFDELKADTPPQLFGKETAEKTEQYRDAYLRGEEIPSRMEMEFITKNNESRWLETSLALINLDGEGVHKVVTAFDITERKKAQQALEQSELKFRSLAESTTAQITVAQDDKYIYANQSFLDYAGLDSEDLALVSPEDLMLGMMTDEAIQEIAPIWQKIQERGDKSFTLEYPDTDGNWFETSVTIVELDGKESFMTMTFDITQHKMAQKEIAANEEKYRTIFETAGTAMISFGEDAMITLANEEWAKLTGYSNDQTVGKKTWLPFFTEESLAKMKKYHEMRTQDPESAPQTYETQLIDRDQKLHDGILSIQVVPGTQQRVASFQDLTKLKQAQSEMYRADKMAALGQIIAGVAHEINNPNNFIYFNLPILKKYIEAILPMMEHHFDDDPDLKILNMPYKAFLEDIFKLIENMEHGSERITGIVSELKTYVHSDEEQEVTVGSVGPVIDRVMVLVGKQVRKTVKKFEVEIADDLPPLNMNPGKIEQVLINLVINAGQAADKEDSWVKLTAALTQKQDFIVIRVEDNGAGITDENKTRIFEPFFTSKGRETGTGLGLSISHQIICDHGGTIDVESTVGEGTCFTVLLPVKS